MKKIILSLFALTLLASCGGKKEGEATKENVQAVTQTVTAGTGRRIIEDVTQYFATFKPTEITTMVLEKDGFEKNFNPGRTMDIAPTIVDFDTYKVGAIVAPETAFDTQIALSDVSIVDRKLVVNYSVVHEGEKRTFTIVPMKAFMYSPQLSIDSVSFVSNNTVKTYAK